MSRRHMILVAMMAAIYAFLPGGLGASGAGGVENLVVLLTDYGTSDFYVGALEGSIYSANPNARISTITHEVATFNVAEGSYILAQAAREYPPGTVFVADVDPGSGANERSIVLETEDGKFFVGPDNGLFTEVMNDLGVASFRQISNQSLTGQGNAQASFKGIGFYGPVAGRLAAGTSPSEVGPEISDPVKIEVAEAYLDNRTIVGAVAHVDHWGNLVTNIRQDLIERADISPGDAIVAFIGDEKVDLAFGTTYSDVPQGEWIAFVNSLGRVEIAINMDSAADAIGASAGTVVLIGRM